MFVLVIDIVYVSRFSSTNCLRTVIDDDSFLSWRKVCTVLGVELSHLQGVLLTLNIDSSICRMFMCGHYDGLH